MINQKKFAFALNCLKSHDWKIFEELCSNILSIFFENLRTMASPSGDRGRDSELFSINNEHKILVQYSVADDFTSKIKQTITKLKKNFPDFHTLIYCTNKEIGAKADNIKNTYLQNENIHIDVRDQNWFLENLDYNQRTLNAATTFFEYTAQPILAQNHLLPNQQGSLTEQERKTALLYLGLQWENEENDKSLTKIAFETLVKIVLKNTTSNNRMSRDSIHHKVMELIPSTHKDDIIKYVNAALAKLSKKNNSAIKYWNQQDEFCLSYDEITKIKQNLEDLKLDDIYFHNEVKEIIKKEIITSYKASNDQSINNDVTIDYNLINHISDILLTILNLYLLNLGETFSSSIINNDFNQINIHALKVYIDSHIKENNIDPKITIQIHTNCNPKNINISISEIIYYSITSISSSGTAHTTKYLKKISDVYTLYAFLKEAPDVKKVTKKIFGYGTIWLDTTIILPLLVEEYYTKDKPKGYTNIITTLVECGIELKVTDGVIAEIVNHIKVSKSCATKDQGKWSGRVPFLYFSYIEEGLPSRYFIKSTEKFHGDERPEDDIQEYLESTFQIQTKSLYEYKKYVDEKLTYEIDAIWSEAHQQRRAVGEHDTATTQTLIKNDVDSYVGIIGLRSQEDKSILGYKHWWLTTDNIAWKIQQKLKNNKLPSSPLMSLYYISNIISFGMHNSKIRKKPTALFLDIENIHFMPQEIISVANTIREENSNQAEHIIKRKIRDACDIMKRKNNTTSLNIHKIE